MKKYLRKVGGVVVSAPLLLAGAAAHAAVDVSDVVTEIQGASAPVAAIGAAVLIVLVGVAVYKWIRRAM